MRIIEKYLESRSDDVYMTKGWLENFPKLRTFAILNKNSEEIGSFQCLNIAMKGQKALITPLFSSNVSLRINDPSEKVSSSVSFEKKVMESIAEFVKASGAKIIDISFPPEFQDMQAFQWLGFQVQPKYTYQVNLLESEKELLENMSSTTRTNLKKAQKELQVFEKNDPNEFLRLCDLTFKRQKENYHRDEIEKILRSSELEKYRSCFFVSENGKYIAAALIVHDVKNAYYSIGGYDHNCGHRGANTLAMWTAISKMKIEGKELFDFQGSMIPSVEKFVRGFGGKKRPYFNVSKTKWYLKVAQRIFQ